MLLSIIIPFYKGNKYINNILSCVLKNKINLDKKIPFDVIIINDSPDETVKINPEYTRELDIKIYTNDINSGIHKSRLEGIKKSSSEYVLMIDQDDLLSQDAFSKICQAIDIYPSYDMLIFNGYKKYIDINDRPDELLIPKLLPHFMITNLFMYCFIENPIASPGQVILKRTSIPKEWSKNIMTANGSDDMLLWMLMIQRNKKIKYVNYPIYFHVETGNNFGRNSDKMNESDLSVCHIMQQYNLINWINIKGIKRNIQFKYLRSKKDKKSNLMILFCYPDILFGRLIYKFIRKCRS